MRRSLVCIPILGVLVAFGLSSASAQVPCSPREQLVTTLTKQFKETPVGIGLAQPGQVLEVFASPSGSWSMVMTMPNGTSCLIAAGENWEMINQVEDTGI